MLRTPLSLKIVCGLGIHFGNLAMRQPFLQADFEDLSVLTPIHFLLQSIFTAPSW